MKVVPMSVELIDSMGSDLSIVNAARVSFAKESVWEVELKDSLTDAYLNGPKVKVPVKSLSEQDQKLIKYLATHNHWSPFAHAFLSFRIKAPIFVARQLVKHQVGLSWNEVSRRYVDDEPEFWFPEVWRGKPVNAKQGSSGVVDDTSFSPVINCIGNTLDMYNEMLTAGVAPEQARMVLPQNTMTEWIWSGSLAAFARVCKQRLDPHAQQETREVAEKIAALVPHEMEHSWKALTN
jgi:thymidylate synthase (FAD)